jgi:hypothetical protein
VALPNDITLNIHIHGQEREILRRVGRFLRCASVLCRRFSLPCTYILFDGRRCLGVFNGIRLRIVSNDLVDDIGCVWIRHDGRRWALYAIVAAIEGVGWCASVRQDSEK